MKSIVLAGGFGSRLKPLTEAINKHLLPVGRDPMIYHPIKRLVEAGIDEILIVTGGNCSDGFLTLLKDGKHLGIKSLYYAHQVGAGGIAEALKLGESFVGDSNFIVLLGDNIFTDSLVPHVNEYKKNPNNARVHLIAVEDPSRFGCPEFDSDGNLIDIIEKPSDPPSDMAVVGIYMYPSTVFKDVLPHLELSLRGELEVTDINRYYLEQGRLNYGKLSGCWSDAGTWPSWEDANKIIQTHWSEAPLCH